MQTRGVRVWFCVAAALVAASIADSLVEFASNSGVFGAGSFTDRSNGDVLPALCAGLLFGTVYVVLRTRRILTRGLPLPGSVVPLLPYVFVLQIALLYAMETLEQLVVVGHALGGTVWLGGPPLSSLAVHGAFCVFATFSLARLFRSLSHKAVAILEAIVAAIGVARRGPAVIYLPHSHRADARCQALILGRSGDRAPPHLAA